MPSIISVSNLSKTYGSGFKALDNINLEINRGEIFALLGPHPKPLRDLFEFGYGLVAREYSVRRG
jgi:ABC-type lipopolysaccharide export system ATPase subunit